MLNNVQPFSPIASVVVSILNAPMALFALLVAHELTAEEKLTPARAFRVVAGLAGVAATAGAGALSEARNRKGTRLD